MITQRSTFYVFYFIIKQLKKNSSAFVTLAKRLRRTEAEANEAAQPTRHTKT